jgi:hypothetical protein
LLCKVLEYAAGYSAQPNVPGAYTLSNLGAHVPIRSSSSDATV